MHRSHVQSTRISTNPVFRVPATRRGRVILGITAVAFAILAPSYVEAGPCYVEMGDAGRFAGTAQRVSGPALAMPACISGITMGTPLVGLGDFEDMYEILITNPAGFLASTVIADGGNAPFDTELFLLDSAGKGLLANDDDLASASNKSKITNAATDLSGAMIAAPGIYYLAITGKNNKPTAFGLNIFNQAIATEISGPDGPGGPFVHNGWNPGNSATGPYLIVLHGVTYLFPIPAVSSAGLFGMTALFIVLAAWTFARKTRQPSPSRVPVRHP